VLARSGGACISTREDSMSRFRLRRPGGAMLIAVAALFVALGGTSYAAFSLPKNSVGSKQLKNNAVSTSKIKNGAVTAGKINTNGLTVPNASHANSANSDQLHQRHERYERHERHDGGYG
jgi:hypothetical protein